MASIIKRGSAYSVRYTYTDHRGKKHEGWESFKTKQEAAELAVLHSSQNGGAKVAVDTTEVKNIWKANGAKPGMVLYTVYTTVYVTPRPGLEEQLKKH